MLVIFLLMEREEQSSSRVNEAEQKVLSMTILYKHCLSLQCSRYIIIDSVMFSMLKERDSLPGE
jgi:hypothetical protein